MTIDLTVLDPKQVASATQFEVLLGDAAQRLLIMSGIAIPELYVDDDDDPHNDDVVVHLNEYVAQLDTAVTNIGLASIQNDESAFAFVVNSGELELDQSSELILRVGAAVLGDDSYLHRFSYQIVAHVTRVQAQISGTIAVPAPVRDIANLDPATLDAAFQISANRIETGGVAGGFGYVNYIPVAIGHTVSIRTGQDSTQFVDYAIDNCPFAIPLKILVKLAGAGWPANAGCGQVAGPDPVTLTGSAPDASGIDFSVGLFPPVR